MHLLLRQKLHFHSCSSLWSPKLASSFHISSRHFRCLHLETFTRSSRSSILVSQSFKINSAFSPLQNQTRKFEFRGISTMAPSNRDVLPSIVKPLHYKIDLYNIQFGGDFAYTGTAIIDLAISEPTHTIVLNAHQLKLRSATIFGQNASDISYDAKFQRTTIAFPSLIAANIRAPITIEFTGTINSDMAGFYRSKYKPLNPPAKSVGTEDGHHLMYSTQFEACDARRAFPCFDEPNLKATFEVSLEIPEDQTALSNMPEKESKPGSRPGLKVVQFERTPKMSTYLLAWAVAELEYVETFTERKYSGKQLPVRVYTTPGYKERGQLGAEVSAKVVDFYSDIFQLEYPLPKIDLLAVHEFSHGAMENWGLITYRITAILFDPKTSDAQYKKRVAYVVAHELAHQWFGNLVTMDWWNELWLNEGFATWVGWHATEHFFPEFQVWSSFVTEAVQTAQNLDGLRASHPVDVPIANGPDVESVFDAISYLKGSSLIRMLVSHLGAEDFLEGIAAYLKKHSYGNAKTTDLWAALSEASGKDVEAFMDNWIRKIGFPVLTIAEEPGQLGIKQNRFLSAGDLKPEEDETLWWIPLGLKTGPQATAIVTEALSKREETLRDVDESFYKINSDSVGFYRTNYPPTRLAQIGAAKDKLSVEDRITLVADAAALAVSGDGTTAGLLTLLENFKDETSYAVWSQIAGSLATVRSVFVENEKVTKGLKAFSLHMYSQTAEKLGWKYPENEDFLIGQLRSLLITAAGGAGHESIIEEAKRQLSAFASGDKDAIHPSLRTAVFRLSIENGGQSEYETVKKEYSQTTSIDGKEVCLTSLGRVPTPELAKEFIKFVFSNDVATQDVHFGAVSLAANAKLRNVLWEYVQSDWDTVAGKLAARPVTMDRFVKTTLSKFASHEMEKSISAFFEDKDKSGWERAVVQAVDTVRTNARYRERDEKLVQEWLEAHQYV